MPYDVWKTSHESLCCPTNQCKYVISLTARDVKTRALDRAVMQINLNELTTINIGSMLCLHYFFQPARYNCLNSSRTRARQKGIAQTDCLSEMNTLLSSVLTSLVIAIFLAFPSNVAGAPRQRTVNDHDGKEISLLVIF